MKKRSIDTILPAETVRDGRGFIVHRPFPNPNIDHVDPFLLVVKAVNGRLWRLPSRQIHATVGAGLSVARARFATVHAIECRARRLARAVMRLAGASIIAGVLAVVASPASAAGETRKVLVLYATTRMLPANIPTDRGLRTALEQSAGRRVELYSEYLDIARFEGETYVHSVAHFLNEKYALHPPDVIVVADNTSLAFLLRNRALIFPRAPVVCLGVGESFFRALPAVPSDIVGALVEYDSIRTIELAFRLQPRATRLVLVTGTGEWDRRWEARLRSEAPRFPARARPEFLAGLPTEAVRKRLGELGEDAVVFAPGYYGDGTGRVFSPRESIEIMAAASAAPVYGPYETFIGTGVVGGYMPSFEATGRRAGEFVNALLDGATPDLLRAVADVPANLNIDWRQVDRWGLDEKAIPGEAVVHFREPTFWARYRNVAIIALVALLIQFALIVALLIERRTRRRATAGLEESQAQMALATRAGRLSTWIWEVARNGISTVSGSLQSAGRPNEAPKSKGDVLETVHPSDRGDVERAIREAAARNTELDIEYRVQDSGGEVRWIAARGRAEDANGQRLVGVAVDVTERKVAELQAAQDRAELRQMARVSLLGQLSASIAHQLNQPLAAILGNAEAAQKMLGRRNVDLAELREICNDIVSEDHRASQVIRRLGELYKRGRTTVEPLDLNELVGETLALVHNELLTRNINVTVDLGSMLPTIEGDRVQLQQVLLNLILNAADAMRETGIGQRQLAIRTETTATDVRCHVVDHGSGIAAEDLEHLFDAFWTTKPGGMGMGLALCQTIVAAHRGSLTAANNVEGGATFCVSLPIGKQP